MTSDLSRDALAALVPLRAYLTNTAHTDAAASVSAAQTQAGALLKEAESERNRVLAEATDEGKRTAQAAADLRSARVRRQANEVVLSQREEIRQKLRKSVENAATALREDPRYPLVRAQLVARGHELLGPAAAIVEMPKGGILVETDSRRLDLSLSTLATGTLDDMAAEVSSLWTR